MYQGNSIQTHRLDDGILELRFNRIDDSINKLDAPTIEELAAAVASIEAETGVAAMIVTSAKDGFIVGADVKEFGAIFSESEAVIDQRIVRVKTILSRIEDLPYPTATAINGAALGGGFELALSTDFRIASTKAVVGFPEVKLGLIPGFGGTVRLPRVIGADNALQWIATGAAQKPEAALKNHAVEAVVVPERLTEATLAILRLALSGAYDWKAQRQRKLLPLSLNAIESEMVFDTAHMQIAPMAGKHFPAALHALESVQSGAGLTRDEALAVEGRLFVKIAKTRTAKALISLFLNDQLIKRKGKESAKIARPVKRAAVIGAGIMGGGIAYQSAANGTPILMKDIADKPLEAGMAEASKLLSKQVEAGRMRPEKAGEILGNIRSTMNYGDFQPVDVVVEAVVENLKVKKAVLAEVEGVVRPDTVLTSNTSSISIDDLAAGLKRPENFLGMHFFNPVHRMQLVEVIKGTRSSAEAVATVVGFASQIGKTPVVVNNCPGFFANRVLFPYLAGFLMLLRDGADYTKCDKIMEAFGWPMGPAYLEDVIGIDTCHRVGEILAEGYPDRMRPGFRTVNQAMFEAQRFGQKSGAGFYKYEVDPKGKPKKLSSPDAQALIAAARVGEPQSFVEEEIIDRMMLPMIIETARCVEDEIVESAGEADTALVLGLGFPPHFGGALKYADMLGLGVVIEKCDKYANLGPLYQPTARMREMAGKGETYYAG